MPNFPVGLTFLAPAERCNQRCPHCILDLTGEPVRDFDLEPQDYGRVISQFVEASIPVQAVLFQGYEVTLPRSWPYVEAAFEVAQAHSIRRGLITNGMLLHRWTDRIVALDTNRIAVSLDGASPEVNDPIRGIAGAFEATVHNLRSFLRKAPHFRNRLAVASCLYAGKNEQSLLEMPKLLRSLGVSRWALTFELGMVDGVGRPVGDAVSLQSTIHELLRTAEMEGLRAFANDELGLLERETGAIPSILRAKQLIDPRFFYRMEPTGHVRVGSEILERWPTRPPRRWHPDGAPIHQVVDYWRTATKEGHPRNGPSPTVDDR